MDRGNKVLVLSSAVMGLVLMLVLSGTIAAAPVLKYLGIPSDNFDPNNDPVAKALEEVTGYKVEYFTLPSQNSTEILNLRLSSPGAYDIAVMYPNEFNGLVKVGALMPLDDLLQKHGQRILSVIGEASWNVVRVNGKIYGVPLKMSADTIQTVLIVRKDILDNLGLGVPTTLDEFYHVCKTIKEKTGILPLAELDDGTIWSAFGLATPWTEVDGELVPKVMLPGMKPYLEFMKRLYDEGLLNPDFPVNNRQQVMEKFTSGQAAMMRMAYWEPGVIIEALKKNVPGAEVAVIQPLIGPNGEQGIYVRNGIQNISAIPMGSKNAEEVVKWWNDKLEVEKFRYWTLGKEGVHYRIEDGKFFPILPAFEKERNNASWFLNGMDEYWYPQYFQARLRKHPLIAVYWDIIMSAAPVCGKYDPLAFAPALPNISKYAQSLAVLERDNVTNFIAGDVSLDEFDEFIQDWMDAGGAASIEEANAWWQENK